jgi:hypothetical protein
VHTLAALSRRLWSRLAGGTAVLALLPGSRRRKLAAQVGYLSAAIDQQERKLAEIFELMREVCEAMGVSTVPPLERPDLQLIVSQAAESERQLGQP